MGTRVGKQVDRASWLLPATFFIFILEAYSSSHVYFDNKGCIELSLYI